METKTITMPLDEYNKLVGENERMKKILKSKDAIGVQWNCEPMGMGCYRNTWNIVTKDKLIAELVCSIDSYQRRNVEIWREYNEFKYNVLNIKESPKKWWQF